MIYYIDPQAASPEESGLSPREARRSWTGLTIRPGDTVLFRRGTVTRGALPAIGGEAGRPVTFGAWGEGANPLFLGSVDRSDPADWREVRPHVWACRLPESEACNFILDRGGVRAGATLCWEADALAAQGDWYDSAMGTTERRQNVPADRQLLFWSAENPGTYYEHVECAVYGARRLATALPHVVFEDLAFAGSGVHGIAGTATDVTVRRCAFCFIGGCVWNRDLKIRFGNGVEFWNAAEDITIEDCFFDNVYDSCTTHQGAGAACRPAKNVRIRRNLFMNYGMAAYEVRDRMPIAASFTDNLCLRAGDGFAMMGDLVPRRSEIWPQPMGHHVFLWRIGQPETGGRLTIARNVFWDAPEGAAVYSIIDAAAEAQLDLHDNTFHTTNAAMLSYLGGRAIPLAECAASGCRRETRPLGERIDGWFAASGMPRTGLPMKTGGGRNKRL